MEKLDTVASALLDKLKVRFGDIAINDENAQPTPDPTRARFFNFDYATRGNVTVAINDGKALRIFYGRSITKDLTPQEKKDWYDFLGSMRKFARRNGLTFAPQDVSRRLSPKMLKDLAAKEQSQEDTALSEGVKFGPLGGYRRSSQQRLGPARIIIRHTTPVDEAVRGSRTRRIERIYVENALGERRVVPANNLAGARAMARHIAEGGDYDDDIGRAIVEMIAEMSDLRRFVREMRDRQFEDATTQDMVEASKCRYQEVKETLSRMKGPKGYGRFKESFVAAEQILSEVDTAELRERFTKKIFPEALEAVLPRVHRAYQMRKQHMRESISPARAQQIARQSGRREFLESFVYTDSRALVARVLEDMAESVSDPADPLHEFAARWADKLHRLEEQVDETLQEEYGLAVQLARGYIKGLQESQVAPSQDQKKHQQRRYDESQEFENWIRESESEEDLTDGEILELQQILDQELPVGVDAENAINALSKFAQKIAQTPDERHRWDLGNESAAEDLNDMLLDLSDDPEADARPLFVWWLGYWPKAAARLKTDQVPVQETVGGDPVEDFLDSVEDPDILKYGDDTADEPVELYRRMNGLI